VDEATSVLERGLVLAREMGMVQDEAALLDARADVKERRGDGRDAATSDRAAAEELRASLGMHG
jgi:hypothetical protein